MLSPRTGLGLEAKKLASASASASCSLASWSHLLQCTDVIFCRNCQFHVIYRQLLLYSQLSSLFRSVRAVFYYYYYCCYFLPLGVKIPGLKTKFNKKAQLSLTNPRDAKACQKLLQFDLLTTLSLTILAYLRLAVVASEICEIPRNSLKIQTYGVQGHPRSSILVSIDSPCTTFY